MYIESTGKQELQENHIRCKELDRGLALQGIQAISICHWRDRQELVRKVVAFRPKLLTKGDHDLYITIVNKCCRSPS